MAKKGRRSLPIRRVLDAVAGARLCYGEPVVAGDRTVIPVARLSATGGYGFGSGANDVEGEGSGGGGGGWLDARPVGFIEIGPDGARYEPIPDPERFARNLKAAATAASTLAAVLGVRRLARAGRRGRLTLGR